MGRFEELSWKLLEYKMMYYHSDKVHPTWHTILMIEDSEYDLLEIEYSKLAEELRVPKSVTNMVDFDFSKPSCKMVMAKLGKERT